MADRRKLAEKLLDLEVKHADALAEIDLAKEALRAEAIAAEEGFTVEVAGKGKVSVSAASLAKLKGILPELVAERFITLSETRKKTLIRLGLVKMAEVWTRDRKPSVSTKHAA